MPQAGCSMRAPRGSAGPCSIRGSTRLTRRSRAAAQPGRSKPQAGDGDTIESRVAQDLRFPAHQDAARSGRRDCRRRFRRRHAACRAAPRTARAAAQQPAPRPRHRLGSARTVPQGAAHPRALPAAAARRARDARRRHPRRELAGGRRQHAARRAAHRRVPGYRALRPAGAARRSGTIAPTSSPSSPRCSSSAT